MAFKGKGKPRGGASAFGFKPFTRKKSCPLSRANAPVLDYKDIQTLTRFTTDTGRVVPSRISGVNISKQRELKKAIKRARMMALLPFSAA